MDDYKSELTAVKLELSDVEQQLDSLLHRQNELINRKEKLEAILTQKSSNKSKDCKQWDKTDFSWSAKLQQTLKSVFNIDKLRPMQLHTMNVTMSNKDCILIMPTGGGKSLCFQLPALLSKGVTLVVSPLVALMEDQVMSLHTYNIDAEMLNADSGKEKVKSIQDAMIDDAATLKLLYVTPEKLSKSKRFMARLEKMYKVGRFSRLVIDEVHCCSQWGHDFRPDYKFLGIMKRQFPEVPILGLTATATSSVLDDVKKILNIQHCELFRASFNRPNLYYEVKEKPSAHKDVVTDIENIIKSKFNNQSGIIYTFSKKECEEISNDLKLKGIKTGCYHADLSSGARSQVHKAWINNQIHVVVATIAFGMGIDKSDVRFVIHHSISKSMENLYQESGRAGRDDKKSHCIVYYRLQDVFRQSAMVMTEQTGLNNLYGILDYCIDVNRCRRSMIARHFDEVWEPSQCNKMCDNCNSTHVTEKVDITVLCNNVLKILDKANEIDNKLTAIKILDAWQGKGPAVNKVKGTDTCKSREFLERILAVMLVKQYIKEDFHFTPYATISYLVPGPKANIIRTGVQKVFMDGIQKKKTGVTESPTKDQVQGHSSSQSATKVRDQGHMSSQSATKVKVTEDRGQSKQSRAENDTKKSPQDSRKETNNLYRPQKRKVVVSNDNDCDLDFGGARSGEKKMKVDSNSKRKVTLDKNNSVGKKSSAKRTIMIDSDSDVDFT